MSIREDIDKKYKEEIKRIAKLNNNYDSTTDEEVRKLQRELRDKFEGKSVLDKKKHLMDKHFVNQRTKLSLSGIIKTVAILLMVGALKLVNNNRRILWGFLSSLKKLLFL